jgi:hypothetical protein
MVEAYGNTPGVDTGYIGGLKSLSGIQSKPGYGLRVENRYYSSTTGQFFNTLIPSNPSRKWLLLRIGALSPAVNMCFSGTTSTTSAFAIHLSPGDIYQVDDHMPWCGAISFEAPAATGLIVEWAEASIQGLV